jgi:hypothetical protein
MLSRVNSSIDLRFGYLRNVPWAVVRADSVEGAAEFMRQVEAVPMEQHDAMTQQIMRTFGGDIARRAAGGDASADLLAEVERFCDVPLDESCGEGCRVFIESSFTVRVFFKTRARIYTAF